MALKYELDRKGPEKMILRPEYIEFPDMVLLNFLYIHILSGENTLFGLHSISGLK